MGNTIEKRKVFVFGNPDVEMDALPVKMLPELQKRFSSIEFQILDPNEDWDIPDEFVAIDTVQGIENVTVFEGLDAFAGAPNVSVHDFDAYANLRLLQKLGRLKSVKIIGVPMGADQNSIFEKVSEVLSGS